MMDVQECIYDIFVSGQKSSVFKFLKKGTDTKLLRTRERQKQSRWKISLFLNSLLSSQEREEARKAREEELERRRDEARREEGLERRREWDLPRVRKVLSTEHVDNQYNSYMRR